MKKLRSKRLAGVGLQLANLSSDMLGYRFAPGDTVFSIVVFVTALALGWYCRPMVGWGATGLGALFCVLLYAIFKLLLPFVLFVRVCDLLRFRFAFYGLCAAGALAVASSSAFASAFAAVDVRSVSLVLGAAVILANMVFMRYGGRMLLLLSHFVAGGLCAFGVVGVMAVVLMWSARRVMVYKLRHTFSQLLSDAEGTDADYLVGIKVLVRNSGYVRHWRISCTLLFLLGLGLAMLLRLALAGGGHSTALLAMASASLAEAKMLLALDVLVPLLAAVSLLVISFSFIRQATDVFERLRGQLMLVFAMILGVSIGWAIGIAERLPPFSTFATYSLIPNVLVAYAMILSASVFLIELGSREQSAQNSGYTLSASAELLSRDTRRNRVFALVAVILAMVIALPLVLHR